MQTSLEVYSRCLCIRPLQRARFATVRRYSQLPRPSPGSGSARTNPASQSGAEADGTPKDGEDGKGKRLGAADTGDSPQFHNHVPFYRLDGIGPSKKSPHSSLRGQLRNGAKERPRASHKPLSDQRAQSIMSLRASAGAASSDPSAQHKSPRATLLPDIFQELFPSSESRPKEEPKPQRHVPRLSLRIDDSESREQAAGISTDKEAATDGATGAKKTIALETTWDEEQEFGGEHGLAGGISILDPKLPGEEPDPDPVYKEAQSDVAPGSKVGLGIGENTAVLILRAASKLLFEADFKCLVPTGKHIEGWSTQGQILNIIRGRNENTLERNGDYYLIFESKASAQTYQKRVYDLHNLAKQYPRKDLTSPLPPAPPEAFDASHLGSLLESYTLRPPYGPVRLNLLEQPWSPMLRSIIEQSGYSRLVAGRRSDFEVMLSVEGALLHHQTVRKCIVRDGQQRRIYWATIGDPWSVRSFDLNSGSSSSVRKEAQDRENADDVPRQAGPEYLHRRFIVSFVNYEEALRFTLSWHRRDIKDLIEGFTGEQAMVNAELTW